ncbi:MAG: flagellar filament capping protein FliD [Oscillospiraceae bacterium]|nr:flagellar filament capping protein FliD [Oscillospiraceae bacterium]
MSNISGLSRINSMRMTGLASGLDIDGLVQKMLSSQQSRLDKAKQQKELVNWQKDAYRSVITTLNTFQSKFLDILSPSSILRATSFKQTATNAPSAMSQYFTASSSSDSAGVSVTVNSIRQLATSQRVESSKSLSKPISMNAGNISSVLGQSVSFTVNGETRNIVLSNRREDYYDDDGTLNMDKLTDDIDKKLLNEFGSVVTADGEKQQRVSVDKESISGTSFNLSAANNTTVQVSGSAAVAGALGFVNNSSNYANLNSSLSSVLGSGLLTDSDNRVSFSINDVEFSFSRTATLRDMMNEINRSSAGVNISYSTFGDKFVIESTKTGSGDFVRLSQQETNALSLMFGDNGSGGFGNVISGQDAVLTVNNTEIVRSSNNINIDGVTINLLQATPSGFSNTEPVTSKVDATQVVNLIKEFVEEYNSLTNTLNGLLADKRPKTNKMTYMPLTEDQKSAMSEKEVDLWEEMGRKGLLNNDPTITKMLSNLRMAVLGAVETEGGGKISFASIGIKTGDYFSDKSGKLIIDEDVLLKAVESDPDSVMRLFTQQSEIPKDARMEDVFQKDASGRFFTTDENGRTKYVTERDLMNMRSNNMGIAQRFSDIFHTNINVTMNERDRGTLIKKVGTGGTNLVIDRDSAFDKRIADMERNIDKIQNRFYAMEAKFYRQFSAMETAMTKLNKQTSFLAGFGEQG